MNGKIMAAMLACLMFIPRCGSGPGGARGILEVVSGDVAVAHSGTKAPARIGDRIVKGLRLFTGEHSVAQVRFGTSVLRVYEKGRITFNILAFDGSGDLSAAGIGIEEGAVLSRVSKKPASGESYRVASVTMVAEARDAEFLYEVHEGGGSVACFQGVVSVVRAGATERVILKAGQMILIEPGKKMKARPVPARFRYGNFEYGNDPAAGSEKMGETSMAGADSARRGQSAGTGTAKAEREGMGNSIVNDNKKINPGRDDTSAETAGYRTPGGLLDKPRSEIPAVK
jgi:hypothetical protein